MGQKKSISILSPIDKLIEVEPLIEAGATELYSGIFPSWFSKYSYFLSPNQRTFKEAQMNERDFSKVAKLCQNYKVPLYLTINNLYFTEEQLPLIVEMAKVSEDMGINGIIMGSLPLILNIIDAGVNVPIHLSTMAVALNHYTISFFAELGIKRFTLPRSLLINEIKSMISHNPYFEYDAFILVGKCPNVEGYCSFLHTNPEKIWPCEQYYNLTLESNSKLLECNLINIQSGWQGFPRSKGCGICAIPDLIDAGITGLKIVGRGSSMTFKLANIKMIKDAVKIHSENNNKATTTKKLKALYKERFGHDCSPYACYFPEIGFSDR